MDATRFADYDSSRNLTGKPVRSLCYAPHTNLFFDRLGSVRVCCWNWSQPAGNITKDSLDDIWHGAQVAALRARLEQYQFAPGCDFCEFQAAEGWFGGAKMRGFDRFAMDSAAPQWPQQMEFSISNACNLECIMCDGDHSSAIRAHREGRPAMSRPYTDEILRSFRKYLPPLKQAKFLGGEPFLVAEHYRIWDMMVEDDLKVLCHVTTNGTQYNDRIERLLARLPFGFAVSLDGATKQTIERVRVNSCYDDLMANVRRFRNYAAVNRTPFSLTYCLMRPNWREFGDFCLMADEWNVPASVNTVLHPRGLSLYAMPVEELRFVLDVMEKQAIALASQLRRNKAVWFDEFERLQRKCAAAEPPEKPAAATPRAPARLTTRNAFILAISDDRQVDRASTALHFLKKFSRSDIIILQPKAGRRLQHDQLIEVDIPPDLGCDNAALFLKTSAHFLVKQAARQYCYVDGDIIAVRSGVDDIFKQASGSARFGRDSRSIDSYSKFALNCGCREASCNHLREAIYCSFDADIPRVDWKIWNSRVFTFNDASEEFLGAWHEAAIKVAKDPYWKDRDQSSLAAMAWKWGVAEQEALSDAFIQQ